MGDPEHYRLARAVPGRKHELVRAPVPAACRITERAGRGGHRLEDPVITQSGRGGGSRPPQRPTARRGAQAQSGTQQGDDDATRGESGVEGEIGRIVRINGGEYPDQAQACQQAGTGDGPDGDRALVRAPPEAAAAAGHAPEPDVGEQRAERRAERRHRGARGPEAGADSDSHAAFHEGGGEADGAPPATSEPQGPADGVTPVAAAREGVCLARAGHDEQEAAASDAAACEG